MNKLCPFCKKNINKLASECPHCRRILIEYIGNNSSVQNLSDSVIKTTFLEKVTKRITKFAKKVNNILNKIIHFKFNKPSFNLNYLGIIPFIILIIVLVSGRTDNQTKTDSPQNIFTNTTENSLPANYNRLPNGMIISSLIDNSNGLGTLEIDNGTDDDAIAKLMDTKISLSVFTVYIQAKSKFTIMNISDGIYKLYFQTGKDWDEKKKKFLFYPSFSKFTDDFLYTTTETDNYDGIRTRYSTYQVTLNPVIGGRAKTNTVTENEFEKY